MTQWKSKVVNQDQKDEFSDERVGSPNIEPTSELLNPFVHHLKLDTFYDWFKVS